jgi:DNA-directed RNA polymerase specialized sigma24 family protein
MLRWLCLQWESSECMGIILGLVARLTDGQQDVLILRSIREMTPSEVTEMLGKTLGAPKALRYRALDSLARSLLEQ